MDVKMDIVYAPEENEGTEEESEEPVKLGEFEAKGRRDIANGILIAVEEHLEEMNENIKAL